MKFQFKFGRVSASLWISLALSLTLALPALGQSVVPDSLSPVEASPLDDAEVYQRYLDLEVGPKTQSLPSLDPQQRAELYERTVKHPVTKLDRVDHYDPTGIIGFCFGRAMTAHLLARQMGLESKAIAKLFIIGDLRSSPSLQGEWRFHVTTVVLGTDGTWYAIDPIMAPEMATEGSYRPLTAAHWISRVRQGWDTWHGGAHRARLYLVPANTILPDIRVLPTPEDGTKVIQLNFDPEKEGIKPSTLWHQRFHLSESSPDVVYGPNEAQTRKFFLTVNPGEPTSGDRFNFLEIFVNDQKISYNSYFVDLMKSEFKGVPTHFNSLSSSTPRVGLSRSGDWIGGFRLSDILAGGEQ